MNVTVPGVPVSPRDWGSTGPLAPTTQLRLEAVHVPGHLVLVVVLVLHDDANE